MRDLFERILNEDDIKGVVLLSRDGKVLFHEFLDAVRHNLREVALLATIPVLGKAKEVEILYENDRIYMRIFPEGLVLVWMGAFARVAMTRLSCEVLVPSLGKALSSKGWRRLFKGISAGS
jgi:hypothetical protein